MRFHIGCSFSLRKLKKFLFPILVGLVSYFLGSGFFGYIPVYATATKNMETYYNITTYDLASDLQQVVCDNESLYDYFISFINSYDYDNSIYDIVISPENYGLNYGFDQKRFDLIIVPKNVGFKYQMFGGNYNNDLSTSLNFYSRVVSTSSFRYFRIQFVGNPSCNYKYSDNTELTELLGYINTGTIPSNFQLHNTGVNMFFSDVIWLDSYNNTLSLGPSVGAYPQSNQVFSGNFLSKNNSNISLDNVIIPFYSSFSLSLSSTIGSYDFGSSLYTYYLKSFNFLDYNSTINVDNPFPTYCSLTDSCFGTSSTLTSFNRIDDLFVSNIPTNTYSNLEVKFSFDYYNPDYNESFSIQPLFYGRVNNSTYYSYEPINCSLTGGTSYGDLTLNATYHISSCSSSLTNYDSIILRLRMTSLDLISNFKYSTNLGHINTAPVYNGSNNVTIMDYFGALSPDFSVLISSTQANSRLEFKGNDRYTFAQRINKATNDISVLSQTGVIYFGTNTNSNIMLYNYTLENNTNTDLYLFFSDDVIVSFSDSGSYTYYDDTDTITTENITIKYLIDTSEYDSSSLTGIINNFLDDIDTSLVDMHVLLNNIYNSLPSYINYLILVLYTLFLLYLLFKILKR